MSARHSNLRTSLPIAFALLSATAPACAIAQISVVGNSVEERTAAAGDTYIGTIVVRNLTSESQPVRIYQSDYSFFADGTSHFDPPGSIRRSNASWITPSTGSIIVPPLGETTVAYTVRVPSIDTLRGTYWSTIMVEGAVNPPRQNAERQVTVGTVMRYAIQIATHLTDESPATVALEKERVLVGSDSTRSIEVEVRNNSE